MANAYSSSGPADRSYVKKAMKAPMLEAEHESERLASSPTAD